MRGGEDGRWRGGWQKLWYATSLQEGRAVCTILDPTGGGGADDAGGGLLSVWTAEWSIVPKRCPQRMRNEKMDRFLLPSVVSVVLMVVSVILMVVAVVPP